MVPTSLADGENALETLFKRYYSAEKPLNVGRWVGYQDYNLNKYLEQTLGGVESPDPGKVEKPVFEFLEDGNGSIKLHLRHETVKQEHKYIIPLEKTDALFLNYLGFEAISGVPGSCGWKSHHTDDNDYVGSFTVLPKEIAKKDRNWYVKEPAGMVQWRKTHSPAEIKTEPDPSILLTDYFTMYEYTTSGPTEEEYAEVVCTQREDGETAIARLVTEYLFRGVNPDVLSGVKCEWEQNNREPTFRQAKLTFSLGPLYSEVVIDIPRRLANCLGWDVNSPRELKAHPAKPSFVLQDTHSSSDSGEKTEDLVRLILRKNSPHSHEPIVCSAANYPPPETLLSITKITGRDSVFPGRSYPWQMLPLSLSGDSRATRFLAPSIKAAVGPTLYNSRTTLVSAEETTSRGKLAKPLGVGSNIRHLRIINQDNRGDVGVGDGGTKTPTTTTPRKTVILPNSTPGDGGVVPANNMRFQFYLDSAGDGSSSSSSGGHEHGYDLNSLEFEFMPKFTLPGGYTLHPQIGLFRLKPEKVHQGAVFREVRIWAETPTKIVTLYDTKRPATAATNDANKQVRVLQQELEHLLMRSYIPVNDHYDYRRLTKRYQEVQPEQPTRNVIRVPLALFPVLPSNTLLTKCRIGVELELAEATEFLSTHNWRQVRKSDAAAVEEAPKFTMTCEPNSVKLYVHTCSLDHGMKETLEPIRRIHRILHNNVKPGFFHMSIQGGGSGDQQLQQQGQQPSLKPVYLKRVKLCRYKDLFGALKTTHVDGNEEEEKAYLVVAIRAEGIYEKFQYSDIYAVHLKWWNDTASTLPRKIVPDTNAPTSGSGDDGFITFKQDPKDAGDGGGDGAGDDNTEGRMVEVILGSEETTRKKAVQALYQNYRKISSLSPAKQLKENHFTRGMTCLFNFEIPKPSITLKHAAANRAIPHMNPHLIMQLQFTKPLDKNINICAMAIKHELTFIDEEGIIIRM